jgi:hypothetical protein
MFDTLMICLPSRIRAAKYIFRLGGNIRHTVRLRHRIWNGRILSDILMLITKSSRLPADIDYSSYITWVQSSSGPIPTESISTGAKGSLKNVLSRWNTVCNRDDPDIPRTLAYKLSYK